jgi:hypothetical protein
MTDYDVTMIVIAIISGCFSGFIGGIVGLASKSIYSGIVCSVVLGLVMISISG